MTFCGLLNFSVCNHLPRSTQPSYSSMGRCNEYHQSLGSKQARHAVHQCHIYGLAMFVLKQRLVPSFGPMWLGKDFTYSWLLSMLFLVWRYTCAFVKSRLCVCDGDTVVAAKHCLGPALHLPLLPVQSLYFWGECSCWHLHSCADGVVNSIGLNWNAHT